MGAKAHRVIRLDRGDVVPAAGALRVSVGGRGRALLRELRARHLAEAEATRARVRQEGGFDPSAEHAAATREMQALSQILKDRTREAFDFYKFVEKLGPYAPVPFQPSEHVEQPGLLAERATLAFPLVGWALMAGIGLPAAVLMLNGAWTLLGSAAVLLLAGPMALRQTRARPGYAARLGAKLKAEHAEEQVRAAAAHAASEEARRLARLAEEDLRGRLRESFGTRSPAPLGDLLEHQLRTQAFPLPVVLDLDFDGFENATVELVLPELDDMPEETTSITHSGRLARKKLERAERGALYDDVCCALALRLVHELFRALPMTQRATLHGYVPQKDQAGREGEKPGLTLEVKRGDFAQLNLLTGNPADLVRQIGKWGGNRKGDVAAV